MSFTIAKTLLSLTSTLITSLIISAEVLAATSVILGKEFFLRFLISFSVASNSFSISSSKIFFFSSMSLSSFFLLSSVIFFASFFEFSIIRLYSLSFPSAFSLSFCASSRSLIILDFLFSILYVILGKNIF